MTEVSDIRPMSGGTFVLPQPEDIAGPQKKHNVKAWQDDLKRMFFSMGINIPLETDGIYGPQTRSFTADLVYAAGMAPRHKMPHGEVTETLRRQLRNREFTDEQIALQRSQERRAYLSRLKKRCDKRAPKVHPLTTSIITDGWGWLPGLHDGVDIVAQPGAVCYAMVKSKIVGVYSDGWYNLGAPEDASIKKDGDGIVIMEVVENTGPFLVGMHIGYGHVKRAVVQVNQVIDAGHVVGHFGYSSGWHIHLMVSNKKDLRGIGTNDPRPLLEYAITASQLER